MNPLLATGNPLDPASVAGSGGGGGAYQVSRADAPALVVSANTPAAAVAEYRRQTGTIVTPAPFIVVPL